MDLGSILEGLGDAFGRSWVDLGRFLVDLGGFGESLGPLGCYLGLWSVSWSLWGRFGLDLEAIFVELGTYLDHLEGLGR